MALSKRFLPLAVLFSLIQPAAALAEEKKFTPYVAARATLEHADANQFVFDNGYGAVAAIGWNYHNHWRGELALSRRESDITGVPPIATRGYFRAWAILGNIYYHPFGIDNRISPYVGIGGGFNHGAVKAISTETEFDGMGFPEQNYFEESWQGTVGVALKLHEGIYLDVAGSYFVSNDHDIEAAFPHKDSVESAYRTYSGLIGLRIDL